MENDNDLAYDNRPSNAISLLVEEIVAREKSVELYRTKWINAKDRIRKLEIDLKEAQGEIAALKSIRTVGNYERVLKAITPERDPRESLRWWQEQLRDAKTEQEREGIAWQINQAEERVYAYDQSKGNQNGIL